MLYFTFGSIEMTPTIVEYTVLLNVPRTSLDKPFCMSGGFQRKLAKMMAIMKNQKEAIPAIPIELRASPLGNPLSVPIHLREVLKSSLNSISSKSRLVVDK